MCDFGHETWDATMMVEGKERVTYEKAVLVSSIARYESESK